MSEKDLQDVWKAVLRHLEDRLGNSRALDVWIRPIRPYSLQEGLLTLEIPNPTFQKGFSSFVDMVQQAFREETGVLPEIRCRCSEQEEAVEEKSDSVTLNPQYKFENFIVGDCNRLAHAAALAVAQSPGTAYNPIFLYGGVGLGKTHLMQAIGHFVHEKHRLTLTYLPCELFVNQFIQSIQGKTTHVFRNRFRNVDFLLIDDIQFISGKEGTQEEFFHTFNTLYDQRKQIILSSDRSPKEIQSLEERLVSRFEWGLVVDLQPPDLETRIAILRQKCGMKDIEMNDDILLYIAEHVTDNIRLLEGVLNTLVAYSKLLNRDPSLSLTEEVVAGVVSKKKKAITMDLILQVVAEDFHISPTDIRGKKRIRNILIPRQIAMYLTREMTDSSLASIAQVFGGKDHTTVLHAHKKITNLIQSDTYIQEVVRRISEKIR